jgi:hypothetical protein
LVYLDNSKLSACGFDSHPGHNEGRGMIILKSFRQPDKLGTVFELSINMKIADPYSLAPSESSKLFTTKTISTKVSVFVSDELSHMSGEPFLDTMKVLFAEIVSGLDYLNKKEVLWLMDYLAHNISIIGHTPLNAVEEMALRLQLLDAFCKCKNAEKENFWALDFHPAVQDTRTGPTFRDKAYTFSKADIFKQIVTNPVSKQPETLSYAIIKLNDKYKWTREEIADWIETLDAEINLTPQEESNG